MEVPAVPNPHKNPPADVSITYFSKNMAAITEPTFISLRCILFKITSHVLLQGVVLFVGLLNIIDYLKFCKPMSLIKIRIWQFLQNWNSLNIFHFLVILEVYRIDKNSHICNFRDLIIFLLLEILQVYELDKNWY